MKAKLLFLLKYYVYWVALSLFAKGIFMLYEWKDSATLEAGVWPANAYTQGLPVPPGSVAWATLDAEHGNCCVNLTGVGQSEYEEYIEVLQQEGFSAVEGVSEQIQGQEDVSIGTLYLQEDKWISISYMPDSFVIYISLEGQQ